MNQKDKDVTNQDWKELFIRQKEKHERELSYKEDQLEASYQRGVEQQKAKMNEFVEKLKERIRVEPYHHGSKGLLADYEEIDNIIDKLKKEYENR